ncbi:MAG: DinB family protein [Anaerolineales bacterium]|nr:DinB family protein [Anaerolineales bacterium]
MISSQIQRQFTYHQWAWRHVFASLKQVDEATYKEERPFFWGSMHGTVAHGLAADFVWLNRCQGHSPQKLPTAKEFANLEAILEQLAIVWDDWEALLRSYSDEDYGRIIHYTTTEGFERQARLVDIVQHMVNHGTEHRSQLTPVLYELGFPTPELDFIYFSLEHAV